MTILARAKALLDLAAKRTQGPLEIDAPDGPFRTDERTILCYDRRTDRQRIFLTFNHATHVWGPSRPDAEYLVAAWDLAEELAAAVIEHEAAVEQARREEREACAAHIDTMAARAPCDTAVSIAAYQTLVTAAEQLRARGAP